MRISLQITKFDYPDIPGTVSRIAKTCEDAGFYSLWMMDHFFQLGRGYFGPAENNVPEGYTTLAYIAALTNQMKLGVLVTGANYRAPGLLLKTVTTLDVLSNGRAILGLGAGWYEREALGLGFPFPPLKTRFEWLEENLQIAHQMWDESNNGPFEGKHFQLKETLNHPQAVSQPHPPIWVGGGGEKKTLRLVAQYADACNLFQREPDGSNIRHKLEVLRGHCEDVGRDYDSIEKTGLRTAFIDEELDTTEKIIDNMKLLRSVGITHVVFGLPEPHDPAQLAVFGDKIIPAVADL